MSQAKIRYQKRYNKFNLQTQCRICLTQSVTTMSQLDSPLKSYALKTTLVYEALELVMGEKVKLDPEYPLSVCVMCIELLKIAYDLKIQYKESQAKLKSLLKEGNTSDKENDEEVNNDSKAASVEIVMGDQKYNLSDLVIIEEDKENATSFDGFLQNLGKSISASFVSRENKKTKPTSEAPTLVIEKLKSEKDADFQTEETDNNYYYYEIENSSEVQDLDKETTNNQPNTQVLDEVKEVAEEDEDSQLTENFQDEASESEAQNINKDDLNLEFTCGKCSETFQSKDEFENHAIICTDTQKNTSCFVCKEQFRSRRQLLVHLNTVHLSGKKKPLYKGSKKYCAECNKTFNSNGSYTYHMSKHIGKIFSCDKCEKYFHTKHQLVSHTQTHNRDKNVVVCPVCGKGFHYSSGLFYHMKMHTNDRKLKCKFCPKTFYTRTSIKRHELTHTGDRPFACQYCDKLFRSTGERKKHQWLHTGERPYACEHCDMGFTQMFNLKMHATRHPGSYMCPWCPKGFVSADIRRFHAWQKHRLRLDSDKEKCLTTEILMGEQQNERKAHQETVRADEEHSEAQEDPEEDETLFGEYLVEDYDNEVDHEGVIIKHYDLPDEVLVKTIEEVD